MKKMLAILLSLAMALACAGAFAEDYEVPDKVAIGTISINGAFTLKCGLPEGYTITPITADRDQITAMLASGFVDSFRHFYPDKEGEYSWWSYRMKARERNAGWRIDYFLLSERLLPNLKSASIHQEVFGSDHCPVEIVMEF